MILNAPMPGYIESWKAFRLASNENYVLGRFLASRISDIGGCSGQIVDIGTGDGRLLQSILFRCKSRPKKTWALEPDGEFMEEARRNLNLTTLVGDIEFAKKRISEIEIDIIANASIILGCHVLYLIEWEEFESVLESMSPDAILFLVFDAPNSVFSRIWETTAKRHLQRLQHSLEQIRSRYSSWIANERIVQSKLYDPRSLREEVRDLVISLLSYHDVRDMDDETYNWVNALVSNHVVDGFIPCDCLCLELKKPK